MDLESNDNFVEILDEFQLKSDYVVFKREQFVKFLESLGEYTADIFIKELKKRI